jgi:hypothetical protein
MGYNKEGKTIIACVKSWQLKEATVYEDAILLCDYLSNHKNTIFLQGDASGENRSAQATTSMWKMIRDVFYDKFDDVRFVVPSKNPPVKDTIQCVNWALSESLVYFDKAERNVYMSLQAIKADKYGEIDKSIDYRNSTSARTHEADTARYAIWHFYKNVWAGRRGGFFIV